MGLLILDKFNFLCPHCGRRWSVGGRYGDRRAAGFVLRGADTHASYCKERTPAERRAVNDRDEKKWEKRAPDHSIIIDYQHKGLTDIK